MGIVDFRRKRMDNQNNRNNKNNPKNNRQGWGVILVTTLLTAFLVMGLFSLMQGSDPQEISYDKFLKMVDEKKVEKVTIDSAKIYITLTDEARKEAIKKNQEENTATAELLEQIEEKTAGGEREPDYYTGAVKDDTLSQRLYDAGVEYEQNIPDTMSSLIFEVFITAILPLILIFLLMNFVMKRMSKGSGMMGIGKSNAKVYVEKQTGVTFQDVAGEDEAKESLQEVVDFLHNPGKYTGIGAKLPKGALLVGPPGTGKTLLAKAVAGEAKVPFFSLSGSAFVEMYVGVGASRVRDLFKQAQQMAPCIVFIDEIDAIGKSRDTRYGGNDEREQTLNQLLAEMDGFDTSKGILILAATNRPEVLDKALLRPGRFDRRIIVDKPDLKGRLETLKVHSKDVMMDETVDLDALALATAGLVGSDLANMINEAAINAVKNGRKFVNQSDLFDAFELVAVGGKEKKDRVMSDKERKIVSYHEVGHAMVTALQKNTEPVQKITIVPRTMGALGYTLQTPEEEKYLQTKDELLAKITTYMAGRAAEVLVFQSATSGAANDIEQATAIARAMVTQYGMSKKFGLIGLQTVESQYLDGRAVMNCSDVTAAEVDSEVMRILKECYEKALELLSGNRSVMDKIAEYLIEKETITGKEFMKIYRKEKGIPEPEENSTEETKSRISENARPEAAVNTQAADSSPEAGAAPAVQEMPAGQKTQDNTEEEIVPKPWDLHFQQSQNTGSAADGSEARPSGEGQNKNTGSTGQSDWWNNSESGIPGQDLNFFHTQESGSGNPPSQQAEEENTQQTSVSGGTTDSEEEKGNDDTSNGPRGPVGRFSNTVLPPSDKK